MPPPPAPVVPRTRPPRPTRPPPPPPPPPSVPERLDSPRLPELLEERQSLTARKLNKELVKIDKSISRFEKVLDSAIDRLEPTPPPTKRIERKISELNKKLEELREIKSKKL